MNNSVTACTETLQILKTGLMTKHHFSYLYIMVMHLDAGFAMLTTISFDRIHTATLAKKSSVHTSKFCFLCTRQSWGTLAPQMRDQPRLPLRPLTIFCRKREFELFIRFTLPDNSKPRRLQHLKARTVNSSSEMPRLYCKTECFRGGKSVDSFWW